MESCNITLIVGLGNPGEKYRNTWHNLGARTVEELARRAGVVLKPGRGEFLGAEGSVVGRKVMLMTPISFMNRSGGPVSLWLRYHKIPFENLLVIYDDHDLPRGRLRIREDGSAGGHRGIEDIIRLSGGERFLRLKIGIRGDREASNLADQVLSPIPKSLVDQVERIVSTAADAAEGITSGNLIATMNKYNVLAIAQ